MMDLGGFTPREIAVASMLGKRFTVKYIAFQLGITPRRVYAITAAVAYKLKLPDGVDDQLAVGDWWNAQRDAA